jgi:hypothetical protein
MLAMLLLQVGGAQCSRCGKQATEPCLRESLLGSQADDYIRRYSRNHNHTHPSISQPTACPRVAVAQPHLQAVHNVCLARSGSSKAFNKQLHHQATLSSNCQQAPNSQQLPHHS